MSFNRSAFSKFPYLLAVVAGCSALPANAGTSTGSIGVSLNVASACAVNGGTSGAANLGQVGTIAFPDQPSVFGNVDASLTASGGGSAISILCTPGLSPTMTVGAGANDSSGVRHLVSGSDQVAYRLYRDSNRSTEITIGEQISLGTATSSAISLPIYGRVNSGGQFLPAGAYTDTVQVTLAW